MYSPMRCLKHYAVFFLALAVGLVSVPDCWAATKDINIPSTFTHVLLTKQTVAPEIEKCLPGVSPHFLTNITSDFPKAGSTITIQNSAGFFVISNTNGYCVQKSKDNYPILAAEAFYKTANPPSDVPKDVTDKLYKDIAVLIAKKGQAKVAYAFNNGNAIIVDYSVKDATLIYPHYFKKAGEWESEKIDIRFTHKMMESFDVTEYDKQTQKLYLLAHRE